MGALRTPTLVVEFSAVVHGSETATFRITPTTELQGLHTFTIGGTALQDGKYPAISEATVSVKFLAGGAGNR